MEDKLETCKNCAWWWPNMMIKTPSVLSEMDMSGGFVCTNKKMSVSSDRDGNWGASTFCPGPDFGCVHWQVKEPL